MGGKNPYIKNAEPKLPTKNYKMFFKPDLKEVVVEADKLPLGHTGLAGSILDIALANGVEIDHACGGVAACSTCHVWVTKGLESCNAPSDEELDQIDQAPSIKLESRLACQCVPDGSKDILIEIPNWNRNLAREGA